MKKNDKSKTIQLIIVVALALISLISVITDPEIYQMVATNVHVKIIFFLLWAVLAVSFIFIYLDFHFLSTYKKDYRELDFAVHTDSVAGIANRYSCDAIIEKYLDKPLPDTIGCIMLDLTSLKEVNDAHGHLAGNNVIRDFSTILNTTSVNLCFVGRNGGNKFMALFEDCTEEKMQSFLSRVDQKVATHNKAPDSLLITYKYGTAFQEGGDIKTINQLIALSNQRIYQ